MPGRKSVFRRTLGCVAALVWATSGFAAGDWFELRGPHFVVLSEGSESRTRDWATEFELFRRAMNIVMPVDEGSVEPVTLVLFRTDRRLTPFKPVENNQPAKVAGYFARAPARNYLAISIEGARDDVRELIFHEGVHWHLTAAARPVPLWLEEGLAEVFGTFRLKGSSFEIGATRSGYMRYVQVAKPMPFAKLAAVAPGGMSFNGQHGDHAALFYRQSWALVHALVFGTEGIGHARISSFLRSPPTSSDPEGELERRLGLTSEAMDQQLARYLQRGRFRPLTFPFDRRAVESEFVIRRPASGEVDLALGNLLVGVSRAAEAEPFLKRALAARADDPRPHDALGTMYYNLDRLADAARHFQEAVRLGSRSYATHFFLGQKALRDPQGAGAGAPNTSEAAKAFVQCLRLNPRFLPASEALSGLLGILPERSIEAETMVRLAAVRWPGNVRIHAGLAFFEAMHGEVENARIALARAQGISGRTDPTALVILNAASARLEQRARSAGHGAPAVAAPNAP